MNWDRQFTRPILMRSTGQTAHLLQLLCARAEDHPDLARHLLAGLDDLQMACNFNTTGTPEPAILIK
jgi:hypothetical protein